jgi:hypothetical protein
MPDFKLHYRSIVIRTALYWHKNRTEDQWNGTEDPETNLCSYRHLILDKGNQNICWRKDHLFNKWCWENWLFTYRRLKVDPYL